MRLVQAHTLRERVAQPVEHLTFNQGVMGSNPIALTREIKGLASIFAVIITRQACSVSAR